MLPGIPKLWPFPPFQTTLALKILASFQLAVLSGSMGGGLVAPSAPKARECETIKTREVCLQHSRWYNHTAMPNPLGHESQQEAEEQLKTFLPLLQCGCSNRLELFLCSAYFPFCSEKGSRPVIGPCRGLCQSVRAKCQPVMNFFGFSWPLSLDCSRFPLANDINQMCIEGPSEEAETLNNGCSHHSKLGEYNSFLEPFRHSSSSPKPAENEWKATSKHPLHRFSKQQQQQQQNRLQNHFCPDLMYPEHFVLVISGTSGPRCVRKCSSHVAHSADQKQLAENVLNAIIVPSIVVSLAALLASVLARDVLTTRDCVYCYVVLCTLFCCTAILIRLLVGRESVSCQSVFYHRFPEMTSHLVAYSLDPPLPVSFPSSSSQPVSSGFVSVSAGLPIVFQTKCFLTFVLLFYGVVCGCSWFTIAALLWCFGTTFEHSSSESHYYSNTFQPKSKRSADTAVLKKCQNKKPKFCLKFLMILSWLTPAILCSCALLSGAVSSDELLGMCFVAAEAQTAYFALYFIPTSCFVLLTFSFTCAGFVSRWCGKKNKTASHVLYSATTTTSRKRAARSDPKIQKDFKCFSQEKENAFEFKHLHRKTQGETTGYDVTNRDVHEVCDNCCSASGSVENGRVTTSNAMTETVSSRKTKTKTKKFAHLCFKFCSTDESIKVSLLQPRRSLLGDSWQKRRQANGTAACESFYINDSTAQPVCQRKRVKSQGEGVLVLIGSIAYIFSAFCSWFELANYKALYEVNEDDTETSGKTSGILFWVVLFRVMANLAPGILCSASLLGNQLVQHRVRRRLRSFFKFIVDARLLTCVSSRKHAVATRDGHSRETNPLKNGDCEKISLIDPSSDRNKLISHNLRAAKSSHQQRNSCFKNKNSNVAINNTVKNNNAPHNNTVSKYTNNNVFINNNRANGYNNNNSHNHRHLHFYQKVDSNTQKGRHEEVPYQPACHLNVINNEPAIHKSSYDHDYGNNRSDTDRRCDNSRSDINRRCVNNRSDTDHCFSNNRSDIDCRGVTELQCDTKAISPCSAHSLQRHQCDCCCHPSIAQQDFQQLQNRTREYPLRYSQQLRPQADQRQRQVQNRRRRNRLQHLQQIRHQQQQLQQQQQQRLPQDKLQQPQNGRRLIRKNVDNANLIAEPTSKKISSSNNDNNNDDDDEDDDDDDDDDYDDDNDDDRSNDTCNMTNDSRTFDDNNVRTSDDDGDEKDDNCVDDDDDDDDDCDYDEELMKIMTPMMTREGHLPQMAYLGYPNDDDDDDDDEDGIAVDDDDYSYSGEMHPCNKQKYSHQTAHSRYQYPFQTNGYHHHHHQRRNHRLTLPVVNGSRSFSKCHDTFTCNDHPVRNFESFTGNAFVVKYPDYPGLNGDTINDSCGLYTHHI